MVRLVVESETVYPDFTHLLDVVSRLGHVHVAVKVHSWQMSSQGFDDWRAYRQVGNEVPNSKRLYPSITSMCREFAPSLRTSLQSSASEPKSAERIEGPT